MDGIKPIDVAFVVDMLLLTATNKYYILFQQKKENQGQDFKDFEDAFFTPSRILPRASLQLWQNWKSEQ